MNTIDKRKEKAEKRAVWLRNYQRARGRALTRLAQQYPDQYKDILEQERLSDEANGKTWLDITGGLPIMVLVFLLAQIDTTTHLSPSKPTEIQRTKATWKEKNENRKLAKQYAWVAFGWRGGEWECLESLWTNESRFDHFASNQQGSSAFGIAQLLGERSRDPALQILRGLRTLY
jgi:hypothetical protein